MVIFDLRKILASLSTITDVTPTHTALATALIVWVLVFLWERKLGNPYSGECNTGPAATGIIAMGSNM